MSIPDTLALAEGWPPIAQIKPELFSHLTLTDEEIDEAETEALTRLEPFRPIESPFPTWRDLPCLEWLCRWLRVRESARRKKHWALAGRIRDMLLRHGVVVRDTKDGPTWGWKPKEDEDAEHARRHAHYVSWMRAVLKDKTYDEKDWRLEREAWLKVSSARWCPRCIRTHGPRVRCLRGGTQPLPRRSAGCLSTNPQPAKP